MGEAKLYVIPGSHPSRSAMLMLDRKGIPFKRVDLMPVISKGVVRAQGFPGVTVPALKLDGRKIQGSREIARELDHIQPEPALYPADPEKRGKVEEAEAWGDEFQQKPRRMSWWAFKRDRSPMASYSEGARLGVPVGFAVKTGAPIVAIAARLNELHRRERARRPGLLSGGPRSNRRLDRGWRDRRRPSRTPRTSRSPPASGSLMSFDDLRPFVEARPCGEMAKRIVTDFPGRTPPSLPRRVARGPADLTPG